MTLYLSFVTNHFYKGTISLSTAEFIQEKSPISKYKNISLIKERLSPHFASILILIPLSCTICGKDFARMDYLKKHQVLHSNDTKFCCGECGELCGSVDGLKKHKAHHHKPSLELNSFEDLALQLPGLEMESIHESIQAVSIDGGKTIMILNDVTEGVHVDMESLDTSPDTILSSGPAELVLAQSELDSEANVLYAVQY